MNKSLRVCRTALALFALIVLAGGATMHGQTYSVLYDFGGINGDPILNETPLAQGADGALYGASISGGAQNLGAFFKMIAPGRVKVLYSFCAQSNCADGSSPAGMTLRVDGHFVGAAIAGGTANRGTLFEITQTGAMTVLYNFTGGADGAYPSAPILGPDGNFYGTATGNGNPSGCGTAYRFSSTGVGGVFSLLHKFYKLPADGCLPLSLVLGTDGNLYGTTCYGGNSDFGTVFKMTTNGKTTLLHSFDGVDDGYCASNLTLGSDGNFYGTTRGNGPPYGGTIFKIAPDGTFTLLHSMSGNDGAWLIAGLVQASDGNFYGAAEQGGTGTGTTSHCPNNCGTLFKATPAGAFTVLHNFDFVDGYWIDSTPFQHTSGVLYGDTYGGGLYDGPGGYCGFFYCGVLYTFDNNLPPFAALIPYEGKVGIPVEILGQGFTPSTTVSFNGAPAGTVKVTNGTRLLAYVPSGATSGYVTVTTSSGTLTSKQPFIVAR